MIILIDGLTRITNKNYMAIYFKTMHFSFTNL